MRILVTGARGSIGLALVPVLREKGYDVTATDIVDADAANPYRYMDVTDYASCEEYMDRVVPDVVIHLAGFKQAPDGEIVPWEVTRINAKGTQNVVMAAERVGAKVILASTCKAGDPETAYGASKLIAERIVLNATGVVARFYNVREAGGNVFRYWESLGEDEPIPYTDCTRFFISLDMAIDLLVVCLTLPTGRYAVDPGHPKQMRHEALRLYPKRKIKTIPRRRGDRVDEPLSARSETVTRMGLGILQIRSPHDP